MGVGSQVSGLQDSQGGTSVKVPWLGQDRTIATKGQYLLASSTLSSLDSRSATWKGWPGLRQELSRSPAGQLIT